MGIKIEDAKQIGESRRLGDGGRVPESVAKFKGPQTPKEVFKAVQDEIKRYPTVQRKNMRGVMTSEAARNAFETGFGEQFDRLYRSYVYDRLLRMGFKEVRYAHGGKKDGFETIDIVYPGTQVEAEDVYLEFRRKFLESIILTFNFDKPRVGHGAFRGYLKETLRTILFDKLDLVEKVDQHGRVIYTEEPRRHKNGKIMLDGEGNVMYKPVMVPRCVADQEKVNRHSKGSVIHECDGQSRTAYEESLREDVVPVHIDNQKGVRGYRDDVNICKYVLRLAKIAYLLALDYMRKHERHKHERQSWRSETIEAIFERFEDEGMVMKNLIDKNVIKGRTNFDNLKSLFHSAWYEKWWRMWSQIATGPKVKVVNGKFKGRDKTQKRFVFRATKSEEEIRVFVTEKEKECMVRQVKLG